MLIKNEWQKKTEKLSLRLSLCYKKEIHLFSSLVLKEHKRKDKRGGADWEKKSRENLQDMIYLYLTYQLQILQIKSESLYFDLIYEMNPVFRFLAYFVTELSWAVLHLQTHKKRFLWTKKTVFLCYDFSVYVRFGLNGHSEETSV